MSNQNWLPPLTLFCTMLVFLKIIFLYWHDKKIRQSIIEGVSKVSRLTKCHYTTISSQISAIYVNVFHKTEVQEVILRCWTGLYLNWFKSYNKNENQAKTQKSPIHYTDLGFFYKIAKNKNGNNCILCHNFWTN